MKHVILLPERYRLGDVLSFKVRRVPSIKCDRLTVCCSPNQRFLYPTASDFEDVAEDLDGWGERRVTADLKGRFPDAELVKISRDYAEVPDLTVTVPSVPAVDTDFLVCPRWKANSSPHRNWEGWGIFLSAVSFSGGVLGHEAKDYAWPCRANVWDLESIAAHMLRTKLVVATDSGLAHLAILLRVPLAVIWGTPAGVIPGQPYEKGCHARMEHQKRAPVWHIEGAWEDHHHAFSEVNKILCAM